MLLNIPALKVAQKNTIDQLETIRGKLSPDTDKYQLLSIEYALQSAKQTLKWLNEIAIQKLSITKKLEDGI